MPRDSRTRDHIRNIGNSCLIGTIDTPIRDVKGR